MPTATDLVTDLPADFEVFGQAVDTQLKALQPGTTLGDLAYSSATANTNTRLGIGSAGQVLTVAGGVPTWATGTTGDIEGVTAGVGISGGGTSGTVTVTNSMATAITTNGDLIYGTGSGTFTRRAIGSTNDVLTVSGGVPTWAAPVSGGMTLISTTTLTGTSTTISSIPTTYNDLEIYFRNATTGTAATAFQLQFNGVTTSSYVYTGGSGGNPSATTYYGFDVGSAPFASNSAHAVVVRIPDYANTATSLGKIVTTNFSVAMNATPGYSTHQVNGLFLAPTTAITSMTVKTFGAGTIGGTVLIYGVK